MTVVKKNLSVLSFACVYVSQCVRLILQLSTTTDPLHLQYSHAQRNVRTVVHNAAWKLYTVLVVLKIYMGNKRYRQQYIPCF